MKKIFDFFTSKKSLQAGTFADIIKGITQSQIDDDAAYNGAVPYVSACVDSISRDVSTQELFFTDKDGKNLDAKKVSKYISEPINSKSNGIGFDQKLAFLVSQLKLHGNGYLYKWSPTAYNVSSGVVDLLPVKSTDVFPKMRLNGNGIDYYDIKIEGNVYRAKPSEVIHIRNTPVINPFIGVGDITKIRLLASGQKAIGEYLSEFFDDQKKTPKTFMVDHTPRMESDAERMRDKLRYKLGNVFYINTSGPEKFDIINSGMLSSDFKFIDQMKYDRETICAVFGVPMIVIGISESSNRSTSSNQIPLYFKSTINPIIRIIENAINDQFVSDYDSNIRFNIQKHASGDIDSVIKMLSNGIITQNRASEMMGEPFDYNDDSRSQYLVPSSLVPIITPIDQTQQQTGKQKKNDFLDIAEAHIKSVQAEKHFQADYLVAALKSRKIVEDKYTQSIEKYFDGAKDRIIKRIDSIKTKSTKVDPLQINIDSIYFMNDEKQILNEEIRPLHTSAVQRAVADVAAISGTYLNVNLSNPFVKAAINRLGTKITGYVPDTTLKELRGVISDSINENVTINELQDRISSKFEMFKGGRARVIARTESRAGWDAGAEAAYKEIGVNKVDVVGCTQFESNTDCGRAGIDVNLISTLIFHPNHVGCLAPSEKI